MQFSCDAIVLSASKYGENSGIACIFTEDRGIYKGLVRGITGKRQRGLYQAGNVIEATWRARLEEQLGNLSAGLTHSYSAAVMDNPIKLAAITSLCSILEATLQERDAMPGIYHSFLKLLEQITAETTPDIAWQKLYILLELELLEQLGFGLDLSECAATGTDENLIYVSPKSGRAVCGDAGKPYHDKLLKLPSFLLQPQQDAHTDFAAINDGLNLCSYFFDKYFFTPHNIQLPQAKGRFVGMVRKESTRV